MHHAAARRYVRALGKHHHTARNIHPLNAERRDYLPLKKKWRIPDNNFFWKKSSAIFTPQWSIDDDHGL
jgi:hypothetical protein